MAHAPRHDAAPPGRPPARRWPHALSSLESSDFRWLFFATLAGSFGNWMETVVRSFVVYELTNSALALGIVHSGRTAPAILFGVFGGVLADRMDRRVLLIVTQTVHGGCGAVLGGLIVAGLIEPWHFGVAGLIEGTVGSVQMPARQALVPSVVPREHLMNAITLSSSTQRIAKTMAPALAGIFAAAFSSAAGLFLEAVLYGIAAFCISRLCPAVPLGRMYLEELPGDGRPAGSAERRRRRRSFLDGFRGYAYLKDNPVVGWLVVLGVVPIIFSFANNTMAPVFSSEVLGLGPSGVGLLLSAPGIGSLAAIFICAWRDDLPRKGLLSMLGILFMGATTIVYGLSGWLWLSLVALVLHGFAQDFYKILNHTLLQLQTPDEYRGRVLAAYHTDRSLSPLGTLAVAGAADLWSPQTAMVLSGVGCVVTVLLVGARARGVRQLD